MGVVTGAWGVEVEKNKFDFFMHFWTALLYSDARTSICFGGNTSDSFDVKTGLHQGSVLSPLFFVIVLNAVSAGITTGLPFEILYADDLVLIADNEEELMPTTGALFLG